MFKKHVSESGSRLLGGKDSKNFRNNVLIKLSITEDQLELLFPKKSNITQVKLSNRSIAYCNESGNPLFFDPNGRNDQLIPTIYALALVPNLIPTLYTHSDVSSKIIGGADLFLQGLLIPSTGLDDFLAGSVRSITIPGNPIPFAVGTMAVSKIEAEREQMKGKGVTVLHSWNDCLWQIGDKLPPNEGFTSLNGSLCVVACDDDNYNNDNGSGDGDNDNDGGNTIVNQIEQEQDTSSIIDQQQQQVVDDNDEVQSTAVQLIENISINTPTDTTTNTNNTNTTTNNTNNTMDTYLEQALFGGLLHITKSKLPIMTSDFYTQYMVPLKPSHVVSFDLKQSKYKKLSRLLDTYEKEKVFTQKSIRKQDHITDVNRSHPLLVGWKGMPAASSSDMNNNSTVAAAGGKKSTSTTTLTVEYLYKAPSSLRPVFQLHFASTGAEKERLYTKDEVFDALMTYFSHENLHENDSSSCIKVDRFLLSLLWNKKDAPEEGSEVKSVDVQERFLSKMQVWYSIMRSDGVQALRKGEIKPISVSNERRFGRNVTIVCGMEGFGYQPDELSSSFQRRFKTACTCSKLPGKTETDHEIMMQGDSLKKVVEFFVNIEGIPSQYVNSKPFGKKKNTS